jgi:protein-S-isoprenylcysteine O-methyltransferase Ste14
MSDDIKPEDKRRMYKSIFVDTAKAMALALIAFAVLLWFYKNQISVSSPSIIIGVIGTVLIFIGGMMISDALGRYGAKGLPQFTWGARMQSMGLGFIIVALLIK